MKQYLELLDRIMTDGVNKLDRTGTGTRSVFGHQMRFNLQDGFPLLTTKKLGLRLIIEELIWMLSGSTDVRELQAKNVHIWDEWADENGSIGPGYGHQWRSWPADIVDISSGQPVEFDSAGEFWQEPGDLQVAGIKQRTIDQITNVVARINSKPDDRRLIVSAWNVADIDKMSLPPCHCFFQFYTRELTVKQRLALREKTETKTVAFTGKEIGENQEYQDYLTQIGVPRRALDCQLYQRSADILIGVPFNIASYALLTMMVAQVVGMAPGEFVHTFGDAHIYTNHFDQVRLQLTRGPRKLPTMALNKDVKSIFDFKLEDFTLSNYDPHPHIAGEVSV